MMDYKVFLIFGYGRACASYSQANSLRPSLFLTVELGGEAESVIALVLLVPVAIVTNAGGGVLAAALISGMRDRVLD